MELEMRASWREWLSLRLGGKGSRARTIVNLGDADNFANRRIRLLALALSTTLLPSQRWILLEADDEIQQLTVVDDVEHRHDLADPASDAR